MQESTKGLPVTTRCSRKPRRQYCQHGAARRTLSEGRRDRAVRYLNDLCGYCGALPVGQLKKGHIKHWIDSHPTWRSPATKRNIIATVLAAFNAAQAMHDVPNPLRGLKKPPARPRLHSLNAEDEQALYAATDKFFGEFLFAAIHTGSVRFASWPGSRPTTWRKPTAA